ncbi:MAG: hypothetical protein RL030_1816 [Pseudomonadota bacterium]|jgi:uncharacterized membrane protein HdeD (DUF308 family)
MVGTTTADVITERIGEVLSEKWWVLLLRGLIAVAFAILIWMQPAITLKALIILFGAFAFADGVLGVWTAFSSRKDRNNWWLLMLWGLVGIGIGIITFVAPGVTALALLFYIAIWAIVTGVLEIITAVRLRKEIEGEWLLGLAGLVSVVFGILLIVHPGAGVLAVLWLLAAYALILGVLMIILAFKVRGWGAKLKAR